MVKCVVSGCPNRMDNKGLVNRSPKRFFKFPQDAARVKVWLAALREERRDVTEQHVICEDHFLTQHVTPQGISRDAIPIMPPYLDISPWGPESSEEEEEQCEEEEEEEGGDGGGPGHQLHQHHQDRSLDDPSEAEAYSSTPKPTKQKIHRGFSRQDTALGQLTRRFLELMLAAPDGVVDLRQVVVSLKTRRRRVYDITHVLDGICLIKKESANMIKWIGKIPVSSFLKKSPQSFQRELGNLKIVEETLDGLIKTCAQQLFDMTDNTENIGYPFTLNNKGSKVTYSSTAARNRFREENFFFTLCTSAYVTHEDISHVKVFQEQTVIIIKAPEETKLEVPAPTEDSIQMHLKGGKGPIKVMMCEMGGPGEAPLPETGDQTGCFITLEESRINTSPLTESSAPQSAVSSS
ncbi:transcription factor E2F6 [Polymixia lowei]